MIDSGILICDTKLEVINKLLNCIKVIIKLQKGGRNKKLKLNKNYNCKRGKRVDKFQNDKLQLK